MEIDSSSGNLIGEGLGWGKSLPVHSVQEIVRMDSDGVPERYIREHVDMPIDARFGPPSPSIPVIDFCRLSSGHDEERRKLDLACRNWGFFQIINHGIAEDILRRIKAAVAGFFELPLEQKKNYSMAPNDLQGYGQAYVVSDDQKLDWNDMLFLMTLPTEQRNLKHWPTVVPSFTDAVDEYADEMYRVTHELFARLSLAMNINKDRLLGLHGEMKQGMRMNYYPPCSKPNQVLGVSPHSDGSSITILLQDDDITGLQIMHQGEWLSVEPIPNALVVNIADAMEVWSNGVYQSIEHRAITNAKKARMSLATFVLPDEKLEIGPLQEMADDIGRPKMYRTVKYLDYLRHTLGRKMEGKAHIDILKFDADCEAESVCLGQE